ncbi:ABC-F family ATP-binding cassette domain-containing protein [bacterium]|nr:ABC-F family ATP-binding cassette domain-containing protein [bacterium]
MIQINGLTKRYADQLLFDDASFVLGARERVGLVGRNGSGKSTLLKMILDEEHADSGSITFPRGYRIGHLSQHLKFSQPTILEEACLGLPKDERDQTYRGEIILSGLGFSQADMQRAPSEFSGGFQIRINLARLLLSEPNLLLLDEPTNYLDIVSARWLEETLREWPGELIVITHDRAFMDAVTTHTMLIYRGTFRKIPGNTQKLYDAIALDEEVYEKTRLNEDKKRKELERFIDRFRAQASKASVVQSRVKALARMEVKEELVEEDSLEFSFSSKPFHGKTVIEVQDLTFGYQADVPLIRELAFHVGKSDRIGIIGKNGRGKSTLLKLLAQEMKPQVGTVNTSPSTSVAYFGQTNIDRLHPKMTIEEEITSAHPGWGRTQIRGICGTMMFSGDMALKKVEVLSGGERSRVLLGKIIATPSNLLLLDEPTNHLDLQSVEALKDALHDYAGAVILVTHNEMLLRELCTRLIVFQGEKPFLIEGGYDYFLDKYGWEDEAPFQVQKPSAMIEAKVEPKTQVVQDHQTTRVSKSAEARRRKLEKEIADGEAAIIALEGEQVAVQKELEALALESSPARIQELSLRLHEISQAIEKAFEDLAWKQKELS